MTAVSFRPDRNLGLLRFTWQNIASLPQIPAIYVFWFPNRNGFTNRCLYVGQPLTLRGRLLQHWTSSQNKALRRWIRAYGPDLAFEFRPSTPNRLIEDEKRFIQKFHPETNIQGVP